MSVFAYILNIYVYIITIISTYMWIQRFSMKQWISVDSQPFFSALVHLKHIEK